MFDMKCRQTLWAIAIAFETLLPVGAHSSPTGEITVSKIERLDETHHNYSTADCSVTLIAYGLSTPNSTVLSVRRECSLDFVPQVGLIGLLLAELKLNGQLESIRTIDWGQITDGQVRLRLADYATKSSSWAKVTENNSKLVLPKNVPEVAALLNESRAFRELVCLTAAMGFDVSVSSVEGVLVDRIKNIAELSELPKSGETVVPYSANVWFSIVPIADE